MIKYEEQFNFIELAEHGKGHGYFILPATQDVAKKRR